MSSISTNCGCHCCVNTWIPRPSGLQKTVRRAPVTNMPCAITRGPHEHLVPHMWILILPFVPSILTQIASPRLNVQNHKVWTWKLGWPCILLSKVGHFRNKRGEGQLGHSTERGTLSEEPGHVVILITTTHALFLRRSLQVSMAWQEGWKREVDGGHD